MLGAIEGSVTIRFMMFTKKPTPKELEALADAILKEHGFDRNGLPVVKEVPKNKPKIKIFYNKDVPKVG